ncbi:coenzyme F(420) biosynthesis enzyme [Selenomonas sp. oral taxon 920]|uniref:coenzyme F(420) biosynthesis enzyme n=1 Tax=Selenomonas sp. oral taxon 920 TaxID=1884263 RepID=UPI000840E6B2|nr:coenzyme F(420) biosynthesis enzyme [Selenomonas sp. oral taxon 920]AOH48357.1 coenzyme F(420) biosynthesis enzyme [Selenomonas sp. oral taxon 920]
MKRFVQMALVLCLTLFAVQAGASPYSDKVTLPEGATITNVNRLAVGAPLYVQVEDTSPSIEILTQVVSDASRITHANIVTYDAVAAGIQTDKGIDIKALPRREAAKVFKENVASYADAYIILTVANNSRTTFFFDVYRSGSNELLYTYEVRANKSDGNTVATFAALSEQFYKNWQRSVEDQNKGK